MHTPKGTSVKRLLALGCAIALILTALGSVSWAEGGQTLRDKFSDGDKETVSGVEGTDEAYYYADLLYAEKGYKSAAAEIEIDLANPVSTDASGGFFAAVKDETGDERASLIWQDDIEYFEWSFASPESALYEIRVEYLPIAGKGTTIQRALSIDGLTPFTEAYNLPFNRSWVEEAGEAEFNQNGDELRKHMDERFVWRDLALVDSEGYFSLPLRFYIESGEHTLRLDLVDEGMNISAIRFTPITEIKDYETIKAEYASKGYKDATQGVKFQAQDAAYRSDPILRRVYDSDPLCEPSNPEIRYLNTIGGSNWQYGNQEITWSFDVPEDGLYTISARSGQWWNDGLPSYRAIYIDGGIPFRELAEYKFDYIRDWQMTTLGNGEENYKFYFTKGEHTITMRAILGPLTEVAEGITKYTLEISEIYRDIIKITGRNPDTNYEYNLVGSIPGLLENLSSISEGLQELSYKLQSVSLKKPSMSNSFETICSQLNSMVKKPDTIASRIDDLYNAQTSLGNYINTLGQTRVQLDYFVVAPESVKVNRYQAGFWLKCEYTWKNFLRSFTKDYDSVGDVYEDAGETISVWISRGTDWAELIKTLADDEFTEQSGIRVNMNILPSGQLSAGAVNALMLAITSGRAPDLALGVDVNSPVEFAIRKSSAALDEMDGFDEVIDRFYPQIMTPYQYNGHTYAIPEQMDFRVLIYRKDVLSELGVSIPDTWDDVYTELLPVLYQNGMEFSPADFAIYLYQNGGSYYTEDGLASALDSKEAYTAFKEWTDQYVSYGMPTSSNFFNRFRNGEMPIGIVGYSDYIKVTTAAPELYGRWDIAQIPGHYVYDENGNHVLDSDGNPLINRAYGGIAGQCSMILENTEKKDACWQFIKWWSSADVQTEFGRELEALLGVQARWNSANRVAFENSNWNREHKDIILHSQTQSREMPVVLGGYYTGRHITNAWTRVVTGGAIPRDSLEKAVKDINKELKAKQAEYGVEEEGE